MRRSSVSIWRRLADAARLRLTKSRSIEISFFFNPTKKEAKAPRKLRLQDIPVSSLRKLGCSVCPRDADAPKLKSPKMEPSGPKRAQVYLLGSAPSEDEDEDNNHWTDKAGDAIYKMFGREFMERNVRSNFVTQCRGDQTAHEIECCRPRIVADIEACRPEVIVGIGDAPLQWAVGPDASGHDHNPGGVLLHRGSLFAVKIGNHACWFYSILYPNYVNKKSYGKSEYEMALEHDVREIKNMVGRLEAPKIWTAPYDTGIQIITGQESGDLLLLERELAIAARLQRSGIDLETTGLRPWMAKEHYHKDAGPMILTASVGSFERTVAFPLDHPEGWGSAQTRRKVKSLFLEYLMESGRKAAHNLAFEMEWLAWEFGADILRRTEWDDTQGLAHTLDERKGTKGLDFQCRMAFGFWIKKLSNIDAARILDYPIRDVLRYNGMDSKWTDLLQRLLFAKVSASAKDLYEYERKVRLAPTLVQTEIKGLAVDFGYARKMHDHFSGLVQQLEGKIQRCPEVRDYARQFGTFSATNTDHVLKLLKDICRRDEIRVEDKRTGAVRWTTDEDALAKIPGRDVPSVPLILEHRGASKLTGTYIDPILSRKIVGADGRVRCKYGAMTAETGRLASDDPNIQNWPKRKHREIRGIFCAEDGRWYVACDYGQIEFRVVGMASEDRNLVKYCWTGYDVHKYWAERMVEEYGPIKDYIVEAFGVDWDEKGLKTLRQEAKNGWVFPQLFGSSIRSCAEQLHLPEDVAQDLGREFWDEFQGVKRWQEKLLAGYAKNLYVETLGGRKRRGPMTPNQIINHPIQGTAADIVLEGMCAISEKADADQDPEMQPALNVHDDLTFDMADASLGTKIPIIAREMCLPRFDYINVPLVVEVSMGKRWHELEEVQVFRSDKLFGTPNPYA